MMLGRALTSIRRHSITSLSHRCLSVARTLHDRLDESRAAKQENIVGSENNFSRSVLLADSSKYKFLAPVWQDSWTEELIAPQSVSVESWESLPTTRLLSTFRTVSQRARGTEKRLSDPENDEMCRVVSERVQDMSDDEIRFMLETLSFWGLERSIHLKNFVAVWKSLDAACLERWRSWSVDKILLFADYWYNLHLARQSDFVYRAITKLATKPKKLTPQQLVQLLFFLNVLRTLNQKVEMYEIEFLLKTYIRELSLKEIGVAVTGFFKTQNVLHDTQLISDIVDRVIREKDSVEEITLTCILKILRSSLHFPLVPKLRELLDSIEPLLGNTFSLQVTCHVALLLTKFGLYHEKVLNTSAQILLDNLKTARMKDMEKIVYTCIHLNHDPSTNEDLFKAVGRELLDRRESEELSVYPMSLVALLQYLSFRRVFPEPLVNRVLDESYLRSVYGKTNYAIRRDALVLDGNVELDFPDYSGVRLSPQLRKYMSRRFYLYPPDRDKPPKSHNRFLFEILQLIDLCLSGDEYAVKHILPHSPRPDIVVRLDDSGSPTVVPEEFRLIPDSEGQPVRPTDSGRWVAIVVAGRNMLAYDGVRLLGETASKMRHLRMLGFESRLVSFYDYPKDDEAMKLQFVKNLIFSVT